MPILHLSVIVSDVFQSFWFVLSLFFCWLFTLISFWSFLKSLCGHFFISLRSFYSVFGLISPLFFICCLSAVISWFFHLFSVHLFLAMFLFLCLFYILQIALVIFIFLVNFITFCVFLTPCHVSFRSDCLSFLDFFWFLHLFAVILYVFWGYCVSLFSHFDSHFVSFNWDLRRERVCKMDSERGLFSKPSIADDVIF